MLLDGINLDSRLEVRHINARYADRIEDLQGGSLKKWFRLGKYLCRTIIEFLFKRPELVVLTPTFYTKPFLKDSLFIWLAWLLYIPRRAAWLHTSYGAMRYHEQPAWFRWYIRTTFKRCTHYICVSESLCPRLPGFMPAERRIPIANGVEPYAPFDLEDRYPQNTKVLRVLFFSNMDEAKGWRILFRVAERMLKEGSTAVFDFYGAPASGWSEDNIITEFQNGKCPEKIRYHGFANGEVKDEVFRHADILCFPSFNEAFPLTILEAMAYGLPIVSSQVGAISDALIDGRGGILVEPNSEEALYQGLKALVANDSLRRKMGEFNQARYRDLYTKEAYVERWLNFLRESH